MLYVSTGLYIRWLSNIGLIKSRYVAAFFIPRGGMVKPKKVPRSQDDLKQKLHDQLQLLRMACETYDRGIQVAGLPISLTLRVLLHTYKKSSHGLLDQLGYLGGNFYSTSRPLNNNNQASEMALLTLRLDLSGAQYLPLLHSSIRPAEATYQTFDDWWGEAIIRDSERRIFSRRDIVMHVADTDGGAHVDPELYEDYMALTRGNSLGWTQVATGSAPEGRPELACVRQIAHEVLVSLHEFVPELKDSAIPVIPVEDIKPGVFVSQVTYESF